MIAGKKADILRQTTRDKKKAKADRQKVLPKVLVCVRFCLKTWQLQMPPPWPS